MTEPRIAPVREPDEAQREILDRVMSTDAGEPLNIFGTLAHHPTLLKRFNVLGGLFMTRSELSPRLREIVILRVAHRTRSEYEWHQHERIARDCGLGEDEIAAIARDDAGGPVHWDETERAVLMFTDELLDHDRVSDATWSALDEQLSVPQLLELTMLVGFYRMTAGFLNTFRVQPEG